MKNTIVPALLAAALLAAGTLVYYLWGYKDSLWIQGSAYLLIIFGWLCVLLVMAMLHPPKPGKDQTGNKTWQWIKHKSYFISYLAWLVALVASFLLIDILRDRRVDSILAQPDAAYATATVTGIEERRLRSTTHIYAIITYTTATENVQQAIKDDERFYKQGQQVRLLYSPQHPDMFRVVALYR